MRGQIKIGKWMACLKGRKRKLNQSVKKGLNQCLEMNSIKRSRIFIL
jgi:hypothetical protein